MGRRCSVSPRRFDSILVSIDIGASRTIRRLNVGERWTFIAGVLALAAKSPVRGALLIALREPVSLDDIAEQAGVTKAVAKSAVDKLVRLDVLEWDDELNGLIVVNWDRYQVEPKKDPTAADRMKRYRARLREQGVAAAVPASIRRAVLERDEWECLLCHATENLEVDHIVPKSKGGHAVVDNLQTLCRECNRAKGTSNEPDDDFRHVTGVTHGRNGSSVTPGREGEGKG
jgi:5-methylcytosine-specific restriction endonuclease McrA